MGQRLAKLSLVLAAMAAIVVATLSVALANGDGHDTESASNRAKVKGVISAIAPAMTSTPATITIQPEEGSAVTVNALTSTVITKEGMGKITVDMLQIGDVAVSVYDKDTFDAYTISVRQPVAKHHGFEGTIKSIADPAATSTSFVLENQKGHNKKGEVTINVNPETEYKVPGVTDASLADFNVGDKVAVLVVEMNGGYTALQVHLIPAKRLHVQHVGTIEAYEAATSSANGSITIMGKKGASSTFVVTTDTKIKLSRGATEVSVGMSAVVVAKRQPGSDVLTAKQIHVFGPKHEGKGNDHSNSEDKDKNNGNSHANSNGQGHNNSEDKDNGNGHGNSEGKGKGNGKDK